MRILIDMNLTPRWAEYLIAAGHDAVHWSTIGPPNAPDEAIFAHAGNSGYVLITNDLDFPQILAHTRQAKPSVILVRGEPLIPELRGASVLLAIDQSVAELNAGAVLTIDWTDKPRARLLPLR